MHPDRHKGRRRARVQALMRVVGDGTSNAPVLYTDVARYPQKRAMCLVVVDNTDSVTVSATLKTLDSGTAEEAAIALAIIHASQLPAPDEPITVVTDSQTACRNIAKGMVTPYTHRILTSIHPTLLHRVRIVWTPGHASLHGNERANAVARELTNRAPSEELSNPDDAPTAPLNYTETLQHYRQSRMYFPPPHKSLNREDAVAWRQLQTNSFPCLYILHLFHPTQYPSYCPYCGAKPTVYHCTWECPQPPGCRPIPSPSQSSWETALTSSEPQEQRRLIQRARGVARANGALN